MAKSLGELRAKLIELMPPKDNTVATQNFIKKHKVVLHPDPAGNGDDVFKATNIKTVNRSPEHGYNPGEDEHVYESSDINEGGYSDIDIKRKEARVGAAKAEKARRIVSDDGMKKDERPQWEFAKGQVNAGTKASSRKGLAITSSERARRTRSTVGESSDKPTFEPKNTSVLRKSKTDLDSKFKNMASSRSDLSGLKKRLNWEKYWQNNFGMDNPQPLKNSVDPRFYDMFDELSEENKYKMAKYIEENGYEKVADVFGYEEE
jgi:hypothetical protein